jgi:hypothetical protein
MRESFSYIPFDMCFYQEKALSNSTTHRSKEKETERRIVSTIKPVVFITNKRGSCIVGILNVSYKSPKDP